MKPFLKWALLLGFIAAFSLACLGCSSDPGQTGDNWSSTVTATAGDGKVTLRWSRGFYYHFRIYYAQTPGVSSHNYSGMQEVKISSQDPDAVTVDVTDLTNGTTYYFVVTYLYVDNIETLKESNESNEVSATPSATPHPPAAPTVVQATPGNGQVTVEWYPVGGATSYNVYYAANPGVTTSSAKVSGAASGQPITGLTNGTTYYFRVTAINAEGESGLSLEVSATPSATPQPPAAPTGVRGTPGDGQIKVEWNPVGGATSYNIYYSTSSPVTKSTGTKVAGATSPQPITGLNNGTTYNFVVTAVNAVGEGDESQEASATPAVPVGVLGVISVALNGVTGNGPSPPATGFGYGPPSLSDDGRYTAFTSSANDLVTFSLAATPNIYLREPLGMHTYIVSVANDGSAANGSSVYPSISGDGRYVVFFSGATNLDLFSNCNQNGDMYVRDRQTPNTFRVTLYKDPTLGTIKQLCSMMFSGAPAISADGRWVAYSNAGIAIYLHDTVTLDYINNIGTPPPEGSIGTYGSQNPVLSGDGSLVAFVSDWNLDKTPGKDGIMNVWLYNRNTGITVRVTNASAARVIERQITMSRDGRYIAYVSSDKEVPGDTNTFSDVYVREMTGPYRDTPGALTRVSVANDGSEANNSSWSPSINSTGSIVAFASAATNLVAGDTNGKSDIFVRDIQSGKTRRVSVGTDGTQANADSSYPAISPNGTVVGFDSTLTNLMAPGMDANSAMDTFIASTGSAPSLIPP